MCLAKYIFQIEKQIVKNRIKKSYPFKSYACLNIRTGKFYQKQTWKSKNILYPTMHHSVMSYEVFNYSINFNVYKCKKVVKLIYALKKQQQRLISHKCFFCMLNFIQFKFYASNLNLNKKLNSFLPCIYNSK